MEKLIKKFQTQTKEHINNLNNFSLIKNTKKRNETIKEIDILLEEYDELTKNSTEFLKSQTPCYYDIDVIGNLEKTKDVLDVLKTMLLHLNVEVKKYIKKAEEHNNKPKLTTLEELQLLMEKNNSTVN